jgi:hypothetical protein
MARSRNLFLLCGAIIIGASAITGQFLVEIIEDDIKSIEENITDLRDSLDVITRLRLESDKQIDLALIVMQNTLIGERLGVPVSNIQSVAAANMKKAIDSMHIATGQKLENAPDVEADLNAAAKGNSEAFERLFGVWNTLNEDSAKTIDAVVERRAAEERELVKQEERKSLVRLAFLTFQMLGLIVALARDLPSGKS